MLSPHPVHRRLRSASSVRGISLVELMIGIAIGMIVVAGATVMMVNQVNEHRRLMLETQIQQDLRAASDLILRELRKAGYRGQVQDGIWSPTAPMAASAASTPFSVTSPTTNAAGASTVEYRYSKDSANDSADVFNPDKEQFGFRKYGDLLQFRLGAGGWQPLTDAATMKVTAFTVDLVVQAVSMADYCELPCAVGAVDCPPRQEVLNFTVNLTGTATHDPAVVRTMTVGTRVRNDRIVGMCPT